MYIAYIYLPCVRMCVRECVSPFTKNISDIEQKTPVAIGW